MFGPCGNGSKIGIGNLAYQTDSDSPLCFFDCQIGCQRRRGEVVHPSSDFLGFKDLYR